MFEEKASCNFTAKVNKSIDGKAALKYSNVIGITAAPSDTFTTGIIFDISVFAGTVSIIFFPFLYSAVGISSILSVFNLKEIISLSCGGIKSCTALEQERNKIVRNILIKLFFIIFPPFVFFVFL